MLLLQEFDLEFKDKKGTENVVAGHLSCLHFETITEPLTLNESFPDEQLMSVEVLPWYVDIVNYLVTGQLPEHWTKQDNANFFLQKERISFGMTLICSSIVQIKLLDDVSQKVKFRISFYSTMNKLVECGFYWPTIFQDAYTFCSSRDMCQRMGSITRRNMMPLNPILVVEIFYGTLSPFFWPSIHIGCC